MISILLPGSYIGGGEFSTVTILPLIERELRVRARSHAVYWTRFAVALVGCLISLPTLVLYTGLWGGSQTMMGHYAFSSLVSTAFFLCCCAGLLTADSISRERREGTLGLLFLTRVKVFDVLLANFGSVGITCICALIAFLPVLTLPVLVGGVTGGEAFRKMVVLFDTLFLSLTVGLWASARGRSWFKSGRSTVLLLVFLIVFPPLFGLLAQFSKIALLSPLGAFYYADDASYRTTSACYWLSITIVHGLSWFFLIAAGIRLQRAMREEDETPESSTPANRENEALQPGPFKPIEDGTDPVTWLMRRQRGILAVIWTAALVGAIFRGGLQNFIIWTGGFRAGSSFVGLNLAASVVEGCLFTWVASRFFIEARRTGELEILLTTPMGAKTIISSQWSWLKHVLVWPIVTLASPTLMQFAITLAALYMSTSFLAPIRWPTLFVQLLSCVNIIVGTGALFWTGLWHGFKAHSQASAILRTVILATGVPYIINFLVYNPLYMLIGPVRFPGTARYGYWILYLAPQIARLLFFLWLIQWAKRRLQTNLAHGGPVLLSQSKSIFHGFPDFTSLVRKARHWPSAPDK